MDHTAYYESILPEPWQIMGLELLPLSVGHLIFLQRVGSPFVGGGTEEAASVEDLLLALAVCSMTWEENVEAQTDPDFEKEILEWGLRIFGRRRIFGFLTRPHPVKWTDKFRLFREYLDFHLSVPAVMFDADQTKSIHCPFAQLVRVALRKHMGMDESEVMNHPWRLAVWDFLSIRALEGQLDFIDETNLDGQLERARKISEKLNAKKNGGPRAVS